MDLTKILAAIDGAIAVAEAVVSLTPTEKDDAVVAALKAYREKFRPIFGAEETGGSEDQPQVGADTIDREHAKVRAPESMGS